MKVKDLFCMYIIRVCGCELSTSRPPLISTCILLFPSQLCDYCSVKSYSCKPSADIHGLHSQYLETQLCTSVVTSCLHMFPLLTSKPLYTVLYVVGTEQYNVNVATVITYCIARNVGNQKNLASKTLHSNIGRT